MLRSTERAGRRTLRRGLFISLYYTTDVIEEVNTLLSADRRVQGGVDSAESASFRQYIVNARGRARRWSLRGSRTHDEPFQILSICHDVRNGQTLCASRSSVENFEDGTKNLMLAVKNWIIQHEEAQVMLASVLVVVGLWWLVRTILSLLVNLVFPLVVVVLAIVCVPQLRTSLLGTNCPAIMQVVRAMLLSAANNMK